MTDYVTEVQAEKKFVGNVVIQIDSNFFAIRQPDSGLSISAPFDRCIESVVLNPTTVDPKRVTTTISSNSFKLVDIDLAISALVQGRARNFIGKECTIWIGRSFVGMDFADYLQLPKVRISKASHPGNAYTFSATEDTDRMQRPLYDAELRLAVDIVSGTTVIDVEGELADLPSSGLVKIDDEFISYAGVDLIEEQLTGCIRGELNTTPAAHSAGAAVLQAENTTDNPLDLLLKILTSGGGGGAYDVLQDGLGISESLIDVAEIEALRDEKFDDLVFPLTLYSIENALKVIENEILAPLNLRFTYSANAKLSLVLLDRAVFAEETASMNEDSITKFPTWDADGTQIVNVLKIQWDYSEASKRTLRSQTFRDEDSIAAYGERQPLSFTFKAVRDAYGGEDLVTDFATRLLVRLSQPNPVVSLNTHLDKSLQNIGGKTFVESSQIPASDGTLNFANEMEIVSRAINIQTGDVQFKLAFTSFTDIRSGYIAPSDLIEAVTSQKRVTLPAGRGTYYRAGWKMRLWDEVAVAYLPDAVNTIESVVGDELIFANNWTTALVPADQRLRFADYEDSVSTQKRYCFVSDGSNNFDDGGAPYRVTY